MASFFFFAIVYSFDYVIRQNLCNGFALFRILFGNSLLF
jgi:hypothetical protein